MTHKVGTKQKEFLFDRNKIILVKELHNELRSLLIVCQIFGAAPPVCDFPDVLLDSKPTNQRIAKALNWIWSLTIIAAIITATQFHKFHIDDTSSILTHTIYACEYVLAITMCIVSILGGKLLHNKYYLILNQMIEVDLVLLRLGVKPKYQQISRSIKKFYAASVCFLIVNISVAADHTKWDPFVTLQMVTIYVLPNIPWTLCIVQFVVVMCHLSYNYEDINSILEGVAADGRNFPTIYITENKTLNIFNEKSNAQAKIIETLRKLHVSLNKIVNLLCNCFGIFLCGTILTGFLTLIVELFHLYRAEEGLLDYKYHQYGYTVLWVIVFGGRIFAVLFISEKVSCAKSETGMLLHNLENENCQQDPLLEKAVNRFSMQLLHDKSSFTAAGIVTLRMSIICGLLNTLTTYLVILVQFDIAARTSSSGVGNTTFVTIRT